MRRLACLYYCICATHWINYIHCLPGLKEDNVFTTLWTETVLQIDYIHYNLEGIVDNDRKQET